MMTRYVVWIGSSAGNQWDSARAWLQSETQWATFPSVREALWKQAEVPSWVIIAPQSRSAVSDDEVAELARTWPLARLVHLVGAWQEGETRSGHPLPGVVRVPWHSFAWRAAAEANENAPSYAGWSLPRTATVQDFILRACRIMRQATNVELARVRVAIATTGYEARTALEEAVVACGFSLAASGAAADVCLWHGRSLRQPHERHPFCVQLERFKPVPLLALLDFPRWDEWEGALALGAVGVLAKPFWLGDLRAAVLYCAPKPLSEKSSEAI